MEFNQWFFAMYYLYNLECSKHKDYVQIANIIYFMIKEITEEYSFREFNEVIRKLSPTKMSYKMLR